MHKNCCFLYFSTNNISIEIRILIRGRSYISHECQCRREKQQYTRLDWRRVVLTFTSLNTTHSTSLQILCSHMQFSIRTFQTIKRLNKVVGNDNNRRRSRKVIKRNYSVFFFVFFYINFIHILLSSLVNPIRSSII